jgi:hypothetical protein
VANTEGKRPLGRFRRWWNSNINMDFRELGWGDIHRIDLAQDMDQRRAHVDTVMKLPFP